MTAPYPTRHHVDVIREFYGDIEAAFAEVGGIAPDAVDLYDSPNWRYCQPVERKHKSKIGFICSHTYAGKRPRVQITVNSFASGGAIARFDSLRLEYRDTYRNQSNIKSISKFTVKRPTASEVVDRKAREEKERARRHQLFLDHLEAWKTGLSSIGDHPYVKSKHLVDNTSLRIDGNKLLLPIENLDGDITALQVILASGRKLIYGKKKGGFISIGDFERAKRLYFCEGYATGDAIYKLVERAQRRKVPFAVIVGLDNHNMEYVLGLFKERFKNKIFTVCPDNDYLKVSEKNGNAGLLSGYNCVLKYHCEIKALPSDCFDLEPGSDWWDFVDIDHEMALAAFSEKSSLTRFDTALLKIGCFKLLDNSVSLKKACVYALHMASTLYPARLDESVVLERMEKAIAYTALSKKDIVRWWVKIKRRLFAQALRAKSIDRVQGQGTRVISISSLEEAHTKVQEIKKEHPRAIFITNAPMGVGKTKLFIQPEFMRSELRGEIPVVITPTKSLTKGVSERFACSHYIDDAFTLRKTGDSLIPDALAITVNSIIAHKFQDIFAFSKSLFIDEYTQVLRSITSGTVEENQRKNTEARLAALISHSDYTFIADADFNQIALDQIQEVVKDSHQIFVFMLDHKAQGRAVNQTVFNEPVKDQERLDTQGELVVQNSDPLQERDNPHTQTVEYRYYREKDASFSHKYLVSEIQKAAKAKQKLYIASDSKKQLDLLCTMLQELDLKPLVIHSDNVNFEKQRAFLDNPNAFLEKEQPQVVLVSPAIQSGVSIEVDYFERCFGIYKGTVAPSVFQQMLHRVRGQKIFELSLPSRMGSSVKESENATAILMGAYQQHIQQFGGVGQVTFDPENQVHTIGEIKIKQEGSQILIEGDDDYARFETLCAKTKALDNQQRHHAANFLLIQAIARGVEITPIDISVKTEEKDLLKSRYKINQTLTEIELNKNIIKANVIDAKTYNKKTHTGGAQNTEDYYEVTRFEIAKDLNKKSEDLNAKDIEFYLDNGCQYLANYQALKQGADKAKEHDTNDKNNGVAKTSAKWRESKVKLLSLLFDRLQIDPDNGIGHYTQEEAKEARDAIKENEALHRYATFKLNLNVDSHLSDTAFVNKIIKKLLGLKVGRTAIREEDERYWIYSINLLDMMRLKVYHKQKFINPDITLEGVMAKQAG